MSQNLNSFKGVYMGDYTNKGVIEGDTGSLDYGSYDGNLV